MAKQRQNPVSRIQLDDARRATMVRSIRELFEEELEIGLSDFQANTTLDSLLRLVGPAIYNQAIQDARAFVMAKLDDLEGEVYEPETPV